MENDHHDTPLIRAAVSGKLVYKANTLPLSPEVQELWDLFMGGVRHESIIEILASVITNSSQLLLIAQDHNASEGALTEIVGNGNHLSCWAAVACHPNASAFHLELIMEYSRETVHDNPYWFATESAIAQCPAITPAIIEELFERNALIEKHFDYRSEKRVLWQKQRIVEYLLGNSSVPVVYHNECLELLKDGVIKVERIA